MVYNGIRFYSESFKGKTLEQFKKEVKHLSLSDDELAEVYQIINPKKNDNSKQSTKEISEPKS